MKKYLNELRPGEKAKIVKIEESSEMKNRLMELGIIEDREIYMRRSAPLGDPMELHIMGYNISLRKSEARYILIDEVSEIQTHRRFFGGRDKKSCKKNCKDDCVYKRELEIMKK